MDSNHSIPSVTPHVSLQLYRQNNGPEKAGPDKERVNENLSASGPGSCNRRSINGDLNTESVVRPSQTRSADLASTRLVTVISLKLSLSLSLRHKTCVGVLSFPIS